MARNRLFAKHSRRIFGERLEEGDRADLSRLTRHVEFLPAAALGDFAKAMVEALWGMAFATHVRRARGLAAQQARVYPERIAELAGGIYYSSWCPYPEGAGGPVSVSGR
jgi:hypothetical protein